MVYTTNNVDDEADVECKYEDDNKADRNDDSNYKEDGAMTNMKRPNFFQR